MKPKQLKTKEIANLFPLLPLFPSFLKRQGLERMKNTIHRHLKNRRGVGFKGNLRRINGPVEPAPTCAALAFPMGTAQAVKICHPPTRQNIRCADSPPMAARAARAGCFIGASTFPAASRFGGGP